MYTLNFIQNPPKEQEVSLEEDQEMESEEEQEVAPTERMENTCADDVNILIVYFSCHS